ncbi:MAG: hypothetical protein D8M53_03945 [Armatimonadetes bacterium]|nr:hypothetical protein [Armatimonadota bacterium]
MPPSHHSGQDRPQGHGEEDDEAASGDHGRVIGPVPQSGGGDQSKKPAPGERGNLDRGFDYRLLVLRVPPVDAVNQAPAQAEHSG